MHGYVDTRLKACEYVKKDKTAHAPFKLTSNKHSQKPTPDDDSLILNETKKKRIEKIIGVFAFYSRAVDLTMLKTLNTFSMQQANPVTKTE